MKEKLILFILVVLTACSNVEVSSRKIPRYDYKDVEQYSLSYLDVFNVNEDKYYLYYYQTTCYHCLEIKDRVIDFALHSDIPVFFIRIEKDEGFDSYEVYDTLYTNDPMKAFARVTPQLSIVEDGFISETVIGEAEILLMIE